MSSSSVSTSVQAGYILHYREFQESSYIVDAFALGHGRVTLFAKSARNSRPQIRALYQPFRPLLLSWVGSGDLRTLTGIEQSGDTLEFTGAPLACAYYMNELVLRLLGKDQVQDEVFAFYALGLSELTQPQLPYEVVLRSFELQVLKALGVLPDFVRCTPDSSPVLAESEYTYHPANAVAAPLPDTAQHGYLKDKDAATQAMHPDGHTPDDGVRVKGSTLLAMDALDFSEEQTVSECRQLMRQILKVQLGDRPLKSRELFTALKNRGSE